MRITKSDMEKGGRRNTLMVEIQFFRKGKLLGEGLVRERSDSYDRIALSKQMDIDAYDRFVLDGGKVDSDKISEEYRKVLTRFELK